jgi:hypothetical protein
MLYPEAGLSGEVMMLSFQNFAMVIVIGLIAMSWLSFLSVILAG